MNRRKSIVLLSMMIISCLFQLFSLFNVVNASQDDDDIAVTLNCKLVSNSAEIHSNLMPIGDYDFFETPELDTGSFSHDNTRIDVEKIQYPTVNSTTKRTFTNTTGISYNSIINTSQVPQYTLSNPLDTVISIKFNYTTNASDWKYTSNTYDYKPTDYDSNIWGIEGKDDKFYLIYTTGGAYVKEFDVEWNEQNSYTIGEISSSPRNLVWDGSYWWIIHNYPKSVGKYDSNFNYLNEYYYIDYNARNVQSFHFNGTHFIVLHAYHANPACQEIIIYDSNWNYVKSHDLGAEAEECVDLHQFGNYFYITNYEIPNNRILVYDLEFNYISYESSQYYPLYLTRGGYNTNWFTSEDVVAGGTNRIVEYFSNAEQHVSTLEVKNFTYQILGVNYTENFTCTYDSSNSYRQESSSQGNQTFYFDSTQFTYYNYTKDVIIPSQNISINLNSSYDYYSGFNECLNLTVWVDYSTNEWRVPSQDNLQINSEEVIDEEYNKGYVSFDDYSETLSITADRTLYFELNSTTYFTFTFDAEIISKTYLKKSFTLTSDHAIIIDDIELSTNLDVKKVYLNNIDLGIGSNNVYSASQTMNQNNIFTLEIILSDSLYIPLQFIYNSLSGGTSNMYFSIYTNTLTYQNYNRFTSFNFNFPSGWNVEHYNVTISNQRYTPYYASNQSENLYSSGYSTISSVQKNTQFNREYYQLNQNGSYLTNNTFSYYKNHTFSQLDFSLNNGTSDWLGDLSDIDLSYTNFTSEINETGHYPATYSFRDDLEGNDPAGWTCMEISSATINVVNELDGHKKIVECYDPDNPSYFMFYDNSFDEASGTIEFYIRMSSASGYQFAMLGYKASSYPIYLNANGGKFQYYQGSWQDIKAYSINTWYHYRIDFDCVTDTYDVYIDDVLEKADIAFNGGGQTSIDKLEFQSHSSASVGVTAWIDAVGYSWDSNYNIGDNENPIPSIINFTSNTQLGNPSTDTIEKSTLFYSYKTNNSQACNISIWNNDLNSFDLVNHTINNEGFYNTIFTLNSSHYNSTNHVLIKYYGYNSTNPFKLQLNQLKLNASFSITDPFSANNIYIDDTLVVTNQTLNLYWNVESRFDATVNVTQLFQSNTNSIHYANLNNNTLQSFSFYNRSAGFYVINLTFTDNYSNYVIYTVNYTIISSISISISYLNPVLVSFNNTFEVNIFSENSIDAIYYDNSSDYITEYNNVSLCYQYEFNFTISYDNITTYNVSVKAISQYNDTFYINITNLQFIKRASILDINNLYSRYDQDQNVSVEIQLRDSYNNALANQNISYTIQAPNNMYIINSSKITNTSGTISIKLNLSIAFEEGFYHLNVSFSETDSYLNYWKLISFEVMPIERSVDSSQINLTINSANVGSDNFIQVNNTSSFSFNHLDNATFDFTVIFRLNYTENDTYSDTFDYDYVFGSTSDITSITFIEANITDFPIDFISYYYDDSLSTNYANTSNEFAILDVIGETFNNLDNFDIRFRKYENQVVRTQVTSTPRTDSNNVIFTETLTANRSFSYWYYENVDTYTINSVSLEHLRTSTIVSSFSETTAYKYYFEKSCNSGDQFTSTVDFDPNWDVSYTVVKNNGTFVKLSISYSCDMAINNVKIIINLNSSNIYAEDWSNNAVQSERTKILEIPNIAFTTTTQTFNITGTSSIPNANISQFLSEYTTNNTIDYEGDYEDLEFYYKGYLKFPRYSQSFLIRNISSNWTLDGVHYNNDTITVNTSTGYFQCSGYDDSITTAYLRFKANPILNISRIQANNSVIYVINCSLPVRNVELLVYFEGINRYTIIEKPSGYWEDYISISEKDYYILNGINLQKGENRLVFTYQVHSFWDDLPVLIIGIVVLGLVLGVVWFKRREENRIKRAREEKKSYRTSKLYRFLSFKRSDKKTNKIKSKRNNKRKKGSWLSRRFKRRR